MNLFRANALDGTGLVWVPVKNGAPNQSWTSDNAENTNLNYGNNTGYALYTAAAWNDFTDKKSLIRPDDPEPLMFLPAAGNRYYYDGSVYYTGNLGYYWSSTVTGYSGHDMYFDSSCVYANNILDRAYGFSVRRLSE